MQAPAPTDPQQQPPVPRVRVAIVGSGPAGFYAADALLRSTRIEAHVDMFDRLPTPYGLVRGGVAPDHPNIKAVTRVYDRTAQRPHFTFNGNVHIGEDLTVDELRAAYDQIIYAVGAETARDIAVPGRGAPGYTPAAVFVGWYNGHPDFSHATFDLSVKRVVVVGNGNVAIDVARILARRPEDLRATDIASYALAALEQSAVEEIVVIGRRGAVQASFAPAELKELLELADVTVEVDPAELALDPVSSASVQQLDPSSATARNLALLTAIAHEPRRPARRRIRFLFQRSPSEVLLDARGHVRGLRLVRNALQPQEDGSVAAVATNETDELAAGLVVPAVGFFTQAMAGVPYDAKNRRIANIEGRVVHACCRIPCPGEFVVGWAATGAQGLIGSHKSASRTVVEKLISDALEGRHCDVKPASYTETSAEEPTTAGPVAGVDGVDNVDIDVHALLAQRGVQVTSFDDWKRLDAIEVERGKLRGAPREKIADVERMVAVWTARPPSYTPEYATGQARHLK